MAGKFYLGVDQGTTGTTALVLNEKWEQVGRGYKEITQIYPKPGWVEHDPEEIWESVLAAVDKALKEAGAAPEEISCIGLDNQGETCVVWNRKSGRPVYNAIVWQDRRTARDADMLAERAGKMIREKTGLHPDAYFSATKIKWILEHTEGSPEDLLAGTLDSWLIWKLTRGSVHATDVSTASRTMLFNIQTGKWDDDILEVVGIPRAVLPEILDSAAVYGRTDPNAFFGTRIPITGAIVDQQAALFGQACYTPGSVKTTYGTGCFMLMNTGTTPVRSENGLLTTVAWGLDGRMTFALDGGIYIAGAAVQWLRDKLRIIESSDDTEAMAAAVGDNGGCFFVPAFAGLAAPHWDQYARGTIVGLTAGVTKEQLVRATLESVAYQVKDNLDVMERDSGIRLDRMRVDGGMTANNWLMQFQADILRMPVEVPAITETTAFGAACLAVYGNGEYRSMDELAGLWKPAKYFEPRMRDEEREMLLHQWHRAVERSKAWIED